MNANGNGQGGMEEYQEFLHSKIAVAEQTGCVGIEDADIHPILKPHQRAIVRWAVAGGCRAIFASFGLGKTLMQLEIARLILQRQGKGRALIVTPLGIRQEFTRDAAMIGQTITFIRRIEEAAPDGLYMTNYESIRDGKLDPRGFDMVSLDEASILRGFGGTKTFRELMKLYEGTAYYRFVATATPSPNEYIELLAYAAYLDIMSVGEAKTRFFKRNSEKADALTIHPHRERDFWLWVASWAIMLQKPSDLGPEYSDAGYDLPPLDVRWHKLPSDHSVHMFARDGQGGLFRTSAIGLSQAAQEKRLSLADRTSKMVELVNESPGEHFVLWHDLEAERHAIKGVLPDAVEVYGAQDLDEREARIIDFSDGKTRLLATKPCLSGAGCNLQRYCHREIFLGIGFKFYEFIQSIHRCYRFLQEHPVRVDLIYTEAEEEIRKTLERKWEQHKAMMERMRGIIQEYGLAQVALASVLHRTLGVERQEVQSEKYHLIHDDAVFATKTMPAESVHLILTSIPFSTQYEYTPSYHDMGHNHDNAAFWQQMDFLTPDLVRVLAPGRLAVIHVKDRTVPGGVSGLGFQSLYPFHCDAITHYQKHGLAFLGMKTIVTDVVRENNQTYRLGWSEQCKDGTKMGCGVPEYLLIFRKPPTDSSNGYADTPVVKSKPQTERPDGTVGGYDYDGGKIMPQSGYSRSRWQIDAHGFTRSNGNRLLTPEELLTIPHHMIYKRWREESLANVYNLARHVEIAEELEREKRLPSNFMLLPPHSWHPDVWTDVARMRTMNMLQAQKGREMHLCLARGSLVLTRARGYVPIQDVKVGDRVLTHKGRWRPVLVAENTGVRAVVTVHAHGVPGLTLTPDHKLWVRKSDWVREREGAERIEPSWVEAQHALSGYVNFKLPEVEPISTGDSLHWWLVGRWLADGHWEARGAAIISFGGHERNTLLAQLAHRAGGVYDTGTALQVRILDPDGTLKSVLARCGHGAAGKHLPPEAFVLPKGQAESLLTGYMSGDGHYRGDRRRWMATSVSRNLLLGIATLIHRVHAANASIYAGRGERVDTIDGREVFCRQEWMLSVNVPDDGRRKQQFILADGAWKKVRRIEDAGEVETWNLRVEEDESYTAEGCIVKNCPMQWDIVDRCILQYTAEGEVVYDPFMGLGTVPLRAVMLRRTGWGVELSENYYHEALHHLHKALTDGEVPMLYDLLDAEAVIEVEEEAVNA